MHTSALSSRSSARGARLAAACVAVAGCAPLDAPDVDAPAGDTALVAQPLVIALPPSLPSSVCPAPGVTVVDAASCGVLPDTGADVAAALNLCLRQATQLGFALRLRAGTYVLGDPLRVPNRATLVGAGAATVLAASTTPNAWTPTEALVEMVGTRDARLCDMTLDHRGTLRTTAAQTLSHTMVLSNAASNLVAGVTFRNPGTRVGTPSGPALLMIARNTGDAGYPGVGTSGNVEANLIDRCRFEIPSTLQMSFAVRLYTDFERMLPPSAFASRVLRNAITRSAFVGDYYWNTIELAGGGTTQNNVEGNTFDGLTLSHVDLDKGASYNTVRGNDVLRGGRANDRLYCFTDPIYATLSNCAQPPWDDGVGAPIYCCHFPAAAYSDHGSDGRYLNVGNVIEKNRVRQLLASGGAATFNEAAITVQHARDAQVRANLVDAVYDGRIGSGIRLESNVAGAVVAENRIGADLGPATPRRVLYGITNGQTPSELPDEVVRDVAVTGNVFVTERAGLSVGRVVLCDPSGATLGGRWGGWRVERNTVNTRVTDGYHAVELMLNAPLVDGNDVTGGMYNFFLNSPGAAVTHNTSRGAGSRNYAWGAVGTLSDNTVAPPPGSCVRLCEAGFSAPPVGNSFVCP